jgi:lipopolysaccharide/colanic/teichoic acid biosynthesis glycosyltransferase
MEPDILATPSAESADPAWATDGETAPASLPLALESPSLSSEATAAHVVAAPVLTPATNGHSHTNGHNGVHVHGGLRERWLLGSQPRATLLGGYAPAHAWPEARTAGSLYLRFGKRFLDVIGALVALVVGAPILLVSAILIKLESPGPVLYRSTRIGRGGRPFTFLKLRSMVDGADRHRQHLNHLNECDGPVFKISRDPRVTRIGRFLRTTSIDEIPQFMNVLRGEMSMVGPRPPIPEEVAHYEPWQMRRLDVRPGITCLWQISGRSRIGFQEWMRLDLEYIKHQSFGLDAKILVRTIPAVLSREGAY